MSTVTVTEKWLQKALNFATVPLLVAISYALARLTWSLLVPEANLPFVEGQVLSREGMETQAPASLALNGQLKQISGWNLFGHASAGEKVQRSKPKEQVKAPETALNLVLGGVFKAEIESESKAIISEKGREAKLYQVGERIPGNAVLEAVYDDYALIKRSGRLETLKFPKQLGSSSNGLQVSRVNNTNGNRSRNKDSSLNSSNYSKNRPLSTLTGVNSKRSTRAGNSTKSGRGLRSSVSKESSEVAVNSTAGSGPQTLLTTLGTSLKTDAEATIKQLGLERVDISAGGGYKVTSSAPRQMLNMVGLRPGDVILSLNGQTLGDLPQDQSLFQQLLSQDEVTVEIERGARRFTVNLDLPN